MKILDECQYLSNLTRLYFYRCSFDDSIANYQCIIDKIWSLPKLTHCHSYIGISGRARFAVPTIKSRSLKSIRTYFSRLQWNQLSQLIEYTPSLKCFTTILSSFPNQNHTELALPTLRVCKLSIYDIFNVLITNVCFPYMPNLHHLNVYISNRLITGSQWEHTIRNNFPKLKVFRLSMSGIFFHEPNLEQKADKLFESFRTPFWINERKWFIRCFTGTKTISLFTRPGRHDYYGNVYINSWRSTSPEDNRQEFYRELTHINNELFFDKPLASNIRLSNIESLCIRLPINYQFWSLVPNLDRLKRLSVLSYDDTYSSQLKLLLDRTPHLQRLRISQHGSLPIQMSLFEHENRSVRELHLNHQNFYFNEDECLRLTRSPLGVQCEVLSIYVKNRQSILHLIISIPKLRSLSVTCADDTYQEGSQSEKDNTELITWLTQRLSSTYVIVRDPSIDTIILIWI